MACDVEACDVEALLIDILLLVKLLCKRLNETSNFFYPSVDSKRGKDIRSF